MQQPIGQVAFENGFYFVSKGRGEPETTIVKVDQGVICEPGGQPVTVKEFKQDHPAAVVAPIKVPKLQH